MSRINLDRFNSREEPEEEDEPTHTPGPWRIHKLPWCTYIGAGPVVDSVTGASRDCIAYNVSEGPNARLIAAAPDLYEALKVMVELAQETDYFTDPSDPDPYAALKTAEAAIAAARAESLESQEG